MQSGVLIIGSLLWDNSDREEWRSTYLNLNKRIPVRVPISYGRRSSSWGNTFTMVFRRDGVLGQAVVVPCHLPVTSIDDLTQKASALWKAEKSSAREGEVGASWGCVGMLFRQEDADMNLVKGWKQYFPAHSHDPISPVDPDGILQIPWPAKSDASPLIEVDLILSTATKPAHSFPTPDEIADAWINQNDGYERYFFENVGHGIRTAEDLEIWRRIEERNPRWLSKPEYAEVRSLLRSETA